MILLLLTGLCAGAFAFWMSQALKTPVPHDYAEEYISIERGSAAGRIIDQLTEREIIQAPLATRLYLRFFCQQCELQAGDYLFSSPISPKEVLRQLKEGKKRSQVLTIPEGWTRFEIAERLAAQFPTEPPLSKTDVLALMDDTSLIEDIDPAATNLEGYLYPTTYQIEKGAHPSAVIARMVQQFKAVWQPEWDAQIKKAGKSKREIVIIASLIESESKIDRERAMVASVIYNRLDQRMALGIDATNVYIAKMLGKWDGIIHKSDVEVDHPYNTRKIYGLPPGPICSPSKTAFEAALNPAKSENLYYVLNVAANDGSHHFYATAAGFAEGKAAYQRWLAQQR